MKTPTTINTGERTVHGMASLQDKLYLLSDSVLIYRADNPYDCIGEIKIPDIKSPTSVVSCCQTSRLYIYDKGNGCIWKVYVPDQQLTRWFDKVKEPCAMSVTHNGEVLMTIQSGNAKQPAAVEIYNQNAILIERVQFSSNIKSLQYIYKLPSGNYIGYGNENLYKFRSDGSTVCQIDIAKYPDSGNGVRRLEVSPYHIFLISSSDSKVCLISLDHAFHRNVLTGTNDKHPINVCYVKATKRLALLEEEVRIYRPNTDIKKLVNVYNVL